MRYTCTLNALGLIEDLWEELHHLESDGLSHETAQSIRRLMIHARDNIRREYVRIHPDEGLPTITSAHEPKDHSETNTRRV